MIITYTKTKNNIPQLEGFDWVAQDWTSLKDTNIFFEYLEVIKDSLEEPFENLYAIFERYEKVARSKAYFTFYQKEDNWIEFLGRKGVFPKIIIYSKEYFNYLNKYELY